MGPFELQLREIKKQYVRGFNPTYKNLAEAKVMGTGRTTGIALQVIGYAMENPGVHVGIRDHLGTDNAHKNCLSTVRQIVDDLRLEFFKFNKADNTVVYALPDWEKR